MVSRAGAFTARPELNRLGVPHMVRCWGHPPPLRLLPPPALRLVVRYLALRCGECAFLLRLCDHVFDQPGQRFRCICVLVTR